MNDRAALAVAFLERCGWDTAFRSVLAGDASDRRYERLSRGDETAVLMDAPPGIADDTETFARIARHLAKLELSPPTILGEDHENGFLLLEDLGDGVFSRLIASDPTLEVPLYTAATDVLLRLQQGPIAQDLPDLSAHDWAEAASFVLSWYVFAVTGEVPDPTKFVTVLADLVSRHADGRRVMIVRDYHAENLLWLPDRKGVARVGLLDFQLAQLGQRGYDLVSLLQDARRDVGIDTETKMITHFCDSAGLDLEEFRDTYAVLGALRALRILGIFARLCLKNGKAGYVPMIPRVWGHLQRNLAHSAVASLAEICADLLPNPDRDNLERIRAQCGLHPFR